MEDRLERESGCCYSGFDNIPPNSETLTKYK